MTTTNQPLNRLEFSFNTFDSLSAQDRSVAFMIACCAHMCPVARGWGRPLCVRLTLFTWITHLSVLSLWREKGPKGKNDEQTPAGAYPVRWPIQRCKICIYDPQWTPKITKYKRRFSWFWIILHSPPWPPLTPPSTASTFQWDRKGPLARRGFMVQPFFILSTEIPWTGPRGQRIPRGSLMDERVETHKEFIREGWIARS